MHWWVDERGRVLRLCSTQSASGSKGSKVSLAFGVERRWWWTVDAVVGMGRLEVSRCSSATLRSGLLKAGKAAPTPGDCTCTCRVGRRAAGPKAEGAYSSKL